MTQKKPKSQKYNKSFKEASNKKSSVNKLQLQLKNIKNDIFKNFKKSKMTQKTPKSQKFKNSKSHIGRPHMKIVLKTNYSYNGKILRMTYSKISKNSKGKKLRQKHLKAKNSKQSKSHIRRPQIKQFSK